MDQSVANISERADGLAIARPAIGHGSLVDVFWTFEAFDKHGKRKWIDEFHNLAVDVGLTDLLEQYFNGSAYTAAHYVGLTDGTPSVAAGDTMASHAGWAEVTAYSESVRQTYNPAAAAAKVITNTASKATFSIDTNSTTVGGAFLTTNNTKSGTTGTLFSAGAFSAGDKSLDSGDSLQVTVQVTASSS